MKKYSVFLFVISLFLFVSQISKQVQANGTTVLPSKESKLWGIEISGNIDTVAGWQHDDANALGTAIGGQMGFFRIPNATAPGRDSFNFYIDQVEVDLNKSFGENIRIRVDLDFGRFMSGSWRVTDSGGTGSNFEPEQGYVTANIPFGRGLEFLIGRFNAPIGYYLMDRPDNPTLSFSTIFKYLTPGNVTGAKFYYAFEAFNNLIDWHTYVINNLADSAAFGATIAGGSTANPGGMGSYSNIPSYGTRVGFNWGAEGKKSTVGLSYAGGPERFGCNGGTASCNAHLTHIFDLDFAVKFTDKFLFAGEGVFRQDNTNIMRTRNDQSFGGFFVLNYDFNEKWRTFFRYGFLQDKTGFYTNIAENIHDLAVGVGYQLTDTTKFKIEYSPEIDIPRVAGRSTSLSNGFAMEFAYNF